MCLHTHTRTHAHTHTQTHTHTQPVYIFLSLYVHNIDMPSCPNGLKVENVDSINCFVLLTWQRRPNTPPVTSTTVTYCPTSSPNCGNSMNCTTSPCIISGLDPGTEYQFTVIPNNNCGSPTGCTGNMATVRTLGEQCVVIQ